MGTNDLTATPCTVLTSHILKTLLFNPLMKGLDLGLEEDHNVASSGSLCSTGGLKKTNPHKHRKLAGHINRKVVYINLLRTANYFTVKIMNKVPMFTNSPRNT